MRRLGATVAAALMMVLLGVAPPAAQAQSAPVQGAAGAAATSAAAPAALTDATCLSCHAGAVGTHPAVQTSSLAHSVHHALQCVDCHTSVTALPHPAQLAPVNCGACHRPQARQLARGAHAAVAGASPQRPGCSDCHGTHAIAPVMSAAFHQGIAGSCGACHADAYRTYRLTPHGQAALLGLGSAPQCSDCHDPHAALAPSNPQSQVSRANLLSTCSNCHAGTTVNFTGFDPHPDPMSRAHSALLYYVEVFMIALLAGVFGFFGLHTLLWLQRSIVGKLRGELPPVPRSEGPYVRRFDPVQRTIHVVVIVSFMLLALTGLPLLYAGTGWSRWLIDAFGGVRIARVIHLINAAITFGYFLFHLGYLAYRIVVKKQTFKLFAPESMVPRWQDILDVLRNFRWFLYCGARPKLDRWTYWEKFDYWAVFWGVAIIGVSGLLLAVPVLFARVLPGAALNIALVVHGEEALLATGFIFIFHFFHNHLRPENFPIDVTVFTGRVSLERFKEERPLQYERLVSQGRLQEVLVAPPSSLATVVSMIFGFAVVITGLILVVLMLVS